MGRQALAESRALITGDPRSARRQRLVAHLWACGPRCILEALLAVEAGQSLDEVLEDFGRLPPEIYTAIGADKLPIT